jgi:Xaa-Pro dipeptidase
MSSAEGLYPAHLKEREDTTARALGEAGFDRLLVHSGLPFTYFADDQDAPFRTTPHFAHWAPVEGPGHLLDFVPGKKPRLVRLVPRDYWYAPPAPAPDFVRDAFDIAEASTAEEAWREAARPAFGARTAFIGRPESVAREHGISPASINALSLVKRLDWERSYKSEYEAATIAEANAKAAPGFAAAEKAFFAGASEMEIHQAYLEAVGCKEEDLPYPTIIGLDDRASTLHYHDKRGRGTPGNVLLIDAGARARMYASDITRTFVTGDVEPAFGKLLDGMKTLQKTLAEDARPGRPYLELHVMAHRLVAALLADVGIFRVPPEEAVERNLTLPFLPHGLGHFLGIQVHDVAGHQADRAGTPAPPPEKYPTLRTTRAIEERQVFTIEPGLYFIPMLLEPHRGGRLQGAFDWQLIDRLVKCGGIRIEDNVYVGREKNRNLTREALPN